MIKTVLSLLLLHGLPLICSAQSMINLTLNTWSRDNYRIAVDDTASRQEGRGLIALPSLGLFRTFRNNLGMGLEAGFVRQSLGYDQSAEDGFLRSRRRLTDGRLVYYLCASMYEQYRYRGFLFMVAAALPVEYRTKQRSEDISETEDKITGRLLNRQTTTYTLPNLAVLTLAGRFCVQRRIVAGLHAGVQLSLGFSNELMYGTRHSESVSTTNGTSQTYRYEVEVSSFDSEFDVSPAILLSYHL